MMEQPIVLYRKLDLANSVEVKVFASLRDASQFLTLFEQERTELSERNFFYFYDVEENQRMSDEEAERKNTPWTMVGSISVERVLPQELGWD